MGVAGCSHLPHLVTLPAQAPVAILIQGAHVFDGEGELSGPQDVLIEHGRITALGPSGSVVVPDSEPQPMLVSGNGRTLMPGLWDAHVHVGGGMADLPWDARLPDPKRQLETLLFAGVTSAINAGHDVDTFALNEKTEGGQLVGPHLVTFTRLFTKRGGHPVPLYRALAPWPFKGYVIRKGTAQLDDAREACAMVAKELARTQASFVKIVYNAIPPGTPRLSRKELETLIFCAHTAGVRAAVHVGSSAEAVEAAGAGADLLMHVPWTDELSDAQVAALAKSKVTLVTTRRIYGVTAAGLRGELVFSDLERAVAAPKRLARLSPKPEGWGEGVFDQAYFESLPKWDDFLGRNIRKLHAARVPMLVGTDSGLPGLFHGPALHRELEALVALGFSTEEVLNMATAKEADFFEPATNRGHLRVGAVADLLLVEGNPLEWIVDSQRIALVIKGGVPIVRSAFHAPLEQARPENAKLH